MRTYRGIWGGVAYGTYGCTAHGRYEGAQTYAGMRARTGAYEPAYAGVLAHPPAHPHASRSP